MHEVSIAYQLVNIAQQAALEAGALHVEAVHLRLGIFSGVAKDALEFAYEIASQGTLLENSTLVIVDVPLVIFCEKCDQEVMVEDIVLMGCPYCGTLTNDIRQGKELEIEYLEIEDATEIT